MRVNRSHLRAGFTSLAPLVASLATAVAAHADGVALTRITGASPFPASCPAPYPFPDAEVEFTLSAEPNHPSRLAAAWIQGPLGSIVAGFSRDGGRTFRPVVIPQLQRCTGGNFDVSSDPSLSVGPDGTLYLASLPSSFGSEASSVWVTRSRNGGRTWSRPAFVDHRNDDSQSDDQETVTADPFHAGRAYVVWSERAKRRAPGGKSSESPELFFARTSDSGSHWTRPRAFSPEPPQLGVATGRIVVPAPGKLVCIYSVQDVVPGTFVPVPGKTTRFMSIRSTDGGHTWKHPALLGTAPTLQPRDPETGKEVRAMAAHNFGAAADRHGDVYAAWAQIRPHSARLKFVASTTAGRSWRRAHDITGGSVEPLFPVLATNSRGTVALTFYDWRRDRPGDKGLTTSVWFRRSSDTGRTWRETRIGGPFDLRTAPYIPPGPNLAGYFLGEYQGLTAVPGGFQAAFPQASPQARQGMTDGFAARVHVSAR